jgi:predicted CoA-binding protein
MPTDDELRSIYADTKTIAVVGASGDESKPAHTIPSYLRSVGFKIIPVSPKGGELFGETVHTSLTEIDEPVDVVDVFRPSEEAPGIAREAAAIGAKVLWLQAGVWSDEAYAIASENGMKVVMDMCMGATHQRLFD